MEGFSDPRTLVVNRASGPSAFRAATAVNNFMLDAGILLALASRSNRTFPVMASMTMPLILPAPSGFRVPSRSRDTSDGRGTGALSSRGSSALEPDSCVGCCCHAGIDGEGRGTLNNPGAIPDTTTAPTQSRTTANSTGHIKRPHAVGTLFRGPPFLTPIMEVAWSCQS
ncbi:hypothetical protein PJL18_03965 [Paenarthrobacter nicotinovorans]|nr:hypothetical protein [Paenarthrobacter nicotinovorans]